MLATLKASTYSIAMLLMDWLRATNTAHSRARNLIRIHYVVSNCMKYSVFYSFGKESWLSTGKGENIAAEEWGATTTQNIDESRAK